MFDELTAFTTRPAPFSVGGAADLWTDPHVAGRMLELHLDPEVDAASRTHAFIDHSAAWMVDAFNLANGRAVLDLGCGPGLYTTWLAAAGAEVTGIDISAPSIEVARERAARAGLQVDHRVGDYLEELPAGPFDLVTMIMCDFCVLSPGQRARLLAEIAAVLAPDGAFLFDLYSPVFHESVEPGTWFAPNLMDGFWSAAPYFGFKATFTYPDELVVLDRYLVLEEAGTRLVHNWLQQFTPAMIRAELAAAGLSATLLGNVAGDAYDPAAPEFAVVASTS